MKISTQLEQLIARMPCSIYWKDIECIYLGCNEFMAKMANLPNSKDVIGKTDFDLPWHVNAPTIRKIDINVMKTGKPVTIEETGVSANGKRRIYLTVKTPVTDNQTKKIIGIFGISMDITSHKRIEKKLQNEKRKILAADQIQYQKLKSISQKITGQVLEEDTTTEQYALHMLNYLENVIACMPGSVYWKDKNGIYRGGNDYLRRLAGFHSRKEIIGKTDYDFARIFGWDKQKADNVIHVDTEVMKSGVAKYNIEEEPFRNVDGKLIYQLSNKVPLFDSSGKVIGLVGISIDITERREIEEDLRLSKEAAEAADKAKTEFLENMRHDIRTPLSGIVGCASTIKENIKDPQKFEEIKEYADNLIASSNTLLSFLNEILEVIKVASGQIPLLKKKFNLREKLINIINLNQSKANHKKLELKFDFDESIPQYLIGDPIRIQRILLELVTNALNFTSKGYIKISAHLAKQHERSVTVKMSVEDTGTGIAPDKQQDIFTRFKRLTPSYEGIYKGTGLGLSIIKEFIDDIDGEIYLESELNKGSVFSCIIPLKEALLDEDFGTDHSTIEAIKPELSLPEVSISIADVQTHSALTQVLLVEDLPVAAKVARSLLIGLGCSVEIAKDGQSALTLAKNNNYDLIFMDIGLPDMSGNEVAKRIREWEESSARNKRTPIIALTAHVDVENKEQCIKAGMDAVLSKPLTKEMAVGILNAFIPKLAALQEQQEIEKEQQDEAKALFELPEATIDLEDAARVIGSKEVAKELIEMLIDSLPQELADLQTAYNHQDWRSIQDIAHKLKGGACYCGTYRLEVACNNLENYLKADKTELSDKLYEQLLREMDALQKFGTI